MKSRLDPFKAAPASMKQWLDMSQRVAPNIEHSLIGLVNIRSSQINACAHCLNMHTAEARKAGETEQRIYLLSAWRDAPCFSPRERAALAWTDALTQLSTARAPDDIYEELTAHFTDEERVELTLHINVINGWNRLMVGFDVFQGIVEMPKAA